MPATYQDDPARQKKRVQSVVMIFQTRRNGMMLDVAAGDKGRPLQKMGTETRSCETLISLHAGSSAVEPCRRTKPVFYSERGGGLEGEQLQVQAPDITSCSSSPCSRYPYCAMTRVIAHGCVCVFG